MGKNLSGIFSDMGLSSLLTGQAPTLESAIPSLLAHAIDDSDMSKQAKQRGHFGSTLLGGGVTSGQHFIRSLLSDKKG